VADADADDVGDGAFEGSDGGHLQAAGPPGADGDERLGRAHGEVRQQRDDGGDDDGRNPGHEEEREHGDERADGGGERAGGGRDPGLAEALRGGVQALAGEGLDELALLGGDVADEVVGVLGGEAANLVGEREELARLGLVVLDGLALALVLGLVDLALALGGQIRARSHRQRACDHAGEAGDEDVMRSAGAAFGGPGHAGDDAEDGAQSVVDAVDGVADPTGGLGLALGAGGHQIVEGALGLVGVELGGRQVVADEVAQGDVVLALVLDHFVENVDGGRIA